MCKLKILFLLLISPLVISAQAPSHFSYQAVIRSSAGQILSNQNITLAIDILHQDIEGESIFSEVHQLSTNASGLISTEIGNGESQIGLLDTINWSNGPFYIRTQIDPLGGNNYTLNGTTKMLSVPFAVYANQADTIRGKISLEQIAGLKPITQEAMGMLNAQDYGVKGDGVSDDTQAIIDLFEMANGQAVFFPPGQYLTDGSSISTEVINMYGVYPQYIDSALVNGTVFRGKLSFTGKNVLIKNIGVDLYKLPADDGLRVTPTIHTGKYCEISNVITLGANMKEPYHSFLIEGFDHVNISNIEVRNAYMGVILKVKGGTLSNVRSLNMYKEGVFIKSDNSFGYCNDLIIDRIFVENKEANNSVGIKILSSGAELENINLSNFFARSTQIGIAIVSAGSNGVAVKNINIENVKIDRASLYSVYFEADKGIIYNTNINNVDISYCRNILTTKGYVKNINLSNVHANANSNGGYHYGITAAEKERFIKIGTLSKRTNFTNITGLLDNEESEELAIQYNNATYENKISNHNLNINGSIPQQDLSIDTITGIHRKIDPSYNASTYKSIAQIYSNNIGSEINTISNTPDTVYTTTSFPLGYELLIHNISNVDISIKNNSVGHIIHPSGNDKTIIGQSFARYIFNGTDWILNE